MKIIRLGIVALLALSLAACTSSEVSTDERARTRDEIDGIDIIINEIDDLEDYRYDDEN